MFRLLTRQQVLKWSIPIGLGLLGVTISKQFSGNKFQESSNLPPKTYENLENFLKAKQWKEADQESTRLMLKIANREKEGWFDTNSIETFPCDFLSTIDRLWVDNSNGKFGLSIQKKIYIEVCGGKTLYYDEKEWQCFGDTVGWRASKYWLRYNDVKFDNTAPKGHLPATPVAFGGIGVSSGLGMEVWYLLSQKLGSVNCKIYGQKQ